jgi:uncharacterized membrane protein YhaH (DUF805 family)
MKTKKRKLELRPKVLLPYILVSILWTSFSLWICIRENELVWSLILISIGLIPLSWEIFISPNIKEIDLKIKQLSIGEKSILSVKGRIRRTTYWTRALIVAPINVVLLLIQDNNPENTGIMLITGLIGLLLSIFITIQGIKRMHDVNKSGWYILFPIYNLILGLTKGTKGDNQYGSDPKSIISIE